jgi:hypothetical protein
LEIVSFKKLRFTDEQIAFALRQADSGTAPKEICRKLGITEQSFHWWNKKFAGLGVGEIAKQTSGASHSGRRSAWNPKGASARL